MKKQKITIEKARELGFCFGVRRAIKIIEAAAGECPDIGTLGPIVHNKTVVEKLNKQGVHVITNASQIKNRAVAITSHGISPEETKRLALNNLAIVDTTCPTVRSAQKAAKKLSETGFGVIIFGDRSHPEVKGLLGWAGKNAIATMDAHDPLISTLPRKLGILSQTTQSKSHFTNFINEVIGLHLTQTTELRIINTLCGETQKRQEAALELAEKSDIMIVVGGQNSANTRHLAELCAPLVETHHIETADEIMPDWITNKKHVGITAGASTPDEAIDEVITRIKQIQEIVV
jgi:4-hydroxy-3-methylbut-2-en-1-yl diphosphate reductase